MSPPPQKPTRPYSYYVATNFHPFDLSVLCQQLEEQHKEQPETPAAPQPPAEPPVAAQATSGRRQKALSKNKKQRQKQRLSTSLGDIKTPNIFKSTLLAGAGGGGGGAKKSSDGVGDGELSKKKSKSNHFVVERGEEYDTIDSSGGGFKRSTCLTATMPARTYAAVGKHEATAQQPFSGKINKFFRQLFHREKPPSTPSTIDEVSFFNDFLYLGWYTVLLRNSVELESEFPSNSGGIIQKN